MGSSDTGVTTNGAEGEDRADGEDTSRGDTGTLSLGGISIGVALIKGGRVE